MADLRDCAQILSCPKEAENNHQKLLGQPREPFFVHVARVSFIPFFPWNFAHHFRMQLELLHSAETMTDEELGSENRKRKSMEDQDCAQKRARVDEGEANPTINASSRIAEFHLFIC